MAERITMITGAGEQDRSEKETLMCQYLLGTIHPKWTGWELQRWLRRPMMGSTLDSSQPSVMLTLEDPMPLTSLDTCTHVCTRKHLRPPICTHSQLKIMKINTSMWCFWVVFEWRWEENEVIPTQRYEDWVGMNVPRWKMVKSMSNHEEAGGLQWL